MSLPSPRANFEPCVQMLPSATFRPFQQRLPLALPQFLFSRCGCGRAPCPQLVRLSPSKDIVPIQTGTMPVGYHFPHIAAILVRMLGHRRSSRSSSTPRCSNSRPTHRDWNRCSRCQHRQGLTERPTRQGAAQRMPTPLYAMISG